MKVSLKPGVFPEPVAAMEKKIRAGNFTDGEMRTCQRIAWEYARDLLSRPLTESFHIQSMENFTWTPDDYEHLGQRGDVVNKDRS